MDWLTLTGLTGAVIAAATTGAVFPPGPWYDKLEKPAWTPPNWLFPLAWTALYVAIIYAAYRITKTADPAPALAFWACQIAFNALWTPIFFGLRKIGSALPVIAALWASVFITLVLFWQRDIIAGMLFVPYIVWVSYAGALNFDIWRRNRGRQMPSLQAEP
ncbi:MAG: TspO/MBR family protein [Pseudomonadota bacterium]